jgi:HSP20 family protein
MLVRRTPFEELFRLQRDLMNLVQRVFGERSEAVAFAPNCEAFYRDGHLVVRAELAGVDPASVDVRLTGSTLTIAGERRGPEVPADDRIFGEIAYGRFERTLELPEGLNAEQVKARWTGGILEITIPVAQAALPKKVPVELVRA